MADFILLLIVFGAIAGMLPLEFCRDLWHQKTKVPRLPHNIQSVIVCLAIFLQHQTHRQSDGHVKTAYTALA